MNHSTLNPPRELTMRALRRLLVLLTCLIAFSAGGLSPASAVGDDYPWRLDTTQTADRWGFTKRQCVSFVAWRMAQRGHPLNNATQKWGSALTWDDTARRLGYGIGTKPVHRGTLRALGLGRIGKTHTLPDRPEIRGMIARVPHLITIEEVESA